MSIFTDPCTPPKFPTSSHSTRITGAGGKPSTWFPPGGLVEHTRTNKKYTSISTEEDEARRGEARRGEARRGEARRGEARAEARRGEARQGKARQGKGGTGEAR